MAGAARECVTPVFARRYGHFRGQKIYLKYPFQQLFCPPAAGKKTIFDYVSKSA